MKTTSFLIALFIAHFACATAKATGDTQFARANSEKPETSVNSTISEVTVYLSGAQITRTASVNLANGTTTLSLENLSPFIDENSIQISGLEDASILSIKYGLDYLNTPKYPEKIEELKQQQKTIELLIERINSEIDGYSKEEDVLNTNKRLGTETVEIDMEKVKAMAAYYRERLTEIRNGIVDSRLKKDSLNKELVKIRKQFNEFNVSDETQKGIITLKLNSNRTSQLDLKITYVVSEAGWFPMYDIRANTVNAPVDLLYKSHVYQKTGVDWDHVDLVLSTGDPNTDNNKPKVDTKFLNFVNPYTYRNNTKATTAYKYKYNPNIKTVSGTVLDDSGLPLPGANVVVKGTNRGTQTDFDGNFNLEVEDGQNLQFSYVGYTDKEIPIHASHVTINLEANNQLDEVIVTAQGINREKKALGYAVSEVDVTRALMGKANGVQIGSSSGASGSGTNVVIRGYNSINENNQALFVVDGVPFSNTNSSDGGSRVLDLDPNEVASVNVLKGLAAATLYGTAGKNGVVVITTKSGTATGQFKVESITTTKFEIATPYSIPTDGDVTVIEVDKFLVPANYEYYAAPLLNENVFLTAKIKEWERFSLLPGEANIYFEGSFSGKTYIDPQLITEELTISLGVDPNVVVKREQLDNFKATSFIGSQRIVSNEFEVSIKNNKSTPIDIKLVDRIPKSQNKDIKIDDIETGDAVYNEETGIFSWTLAIPSNDNMQKRFSYRLKYPKFKSINL